MCVLVMFFDESGKDENIVHVYDDPSFCNEVSIKVIHYVLKGSEHIGKFKEHNIWLEKSFVSNKCYLPLVFISDTYIIIATSKIQLYENDSMYKFVNKFRDER